MTLLAGPMHNHSVPWALRSCCLCHLVQDLLHHHFRIECPVKCIQGVLYVRLSVQIYNEPEDYQRLDSAILSILRSSIEASH